MLPGRLPLNEGAFEHWNSDLERESQSRSFSLDPQGALDGLQAAFRLQPRSFPGHLLAVAYLSGALEFHCRTRHRFAVAYEYLTHAHRSPSFCAWFCGQAPDWDTLERLTEGLLHPQERILYRLACALSQMRWIGFREVRIDCFHGSERYRWRCTSRGQRLTRHACRPPNLQGFKLWLWENHLPLKWNCGRNEIRTGQEERVWLERAAEFSPLQVFVDGMPLQPQNPSHSVELAPGAWLGGQSVVIPVFEGVTLDRLPMDSLEGLNLVVSSDSLRLDAGCSGLVRDDAWQQQLADAQRTLLEQLARQQLSFAARHRLLPSFPNPLLKSVGLLRLQRGVLTGGELLSRFGDNPWSLAEEVHPEDARELARLLPARLGFDQGYGDVSWRSHRDGEFGSLLQETFVLVGRTFPPHDWTCFYYGGLKWPAVSWHPVHPWVLVHSSNRWLIWDAAKRCSVTELNWDVDEVVFSACGKRLWANSGRELRSYCLDSQAPLEFGSMQLDRLVDLTKPGYFLQGNPACLCSWDDPETVLYRFDKAKVRDWEVSADGRWLWAVEIGIGRLLLLRLDDLKEFILYENGEGLSAKFSTDSAYLMLERNDSSWSVYDLQAGRFVRENLRGTLLRDGTLVGEDGLLSQLISLEHCVEVFPDPILKRSGLRVYQGQQVFRLWDVANPQFTFQCRRFRWVGATGLHEISAGGYRFVPGLRLIGKALIRLEEGGFSYLHPDSLEPRFHREGNWREVFSKNCCLGSSWEIHHRFTQFWAVHLHTGEVLEDHEFPFVTAGGDRRIPPAGFNGQWIITMGENFLHWAEIGPAKLGKMPKKGFPEIVLSPDSNEAFISTQGTWNLTRLGGAEIFLSPVAGKRPRFCPGRSYFSIVEAGRVRILDRSSRKTLGEVAGTSATWLEDGLLLVDGICYLEGTGGWGSCGRVSFGTNEIWPDLEGDGSGLLVSKYNGEFRFLEIFGGYHLGTLHPMGDDWAFWEPSGDYDGTKIGLKQAWRMPDRSPLDPERFQPGLLSTLFRAERPSRAAGPD